MHSGCYSAQSLQSGDGGSTREDGYRAYGRDECVAREALKAEWKARERYALDSQARDSD